MTPEEIQAMAKGLAQGQAVWYVVSACIGGAIAGLGTYLGEKGKNRATKEDIVDITNKVKEVEYVFSRGLEDLKARHQLRMVAAERRIETHQIAYGLWYEMVQATNYKDDEAAESAKCDCLEWLHANGFFLSTASTDSLYDACEAVYSYRVGLQEGDDEKKQAANETLWAAGRILREEVALPAISHPVVHERV